MASSPTDSAPGNRIMLTREELFARVWTTPMLRLAEEFGVSDVAVAKLCQRRNIPRPPPGYWAKLAAGRPAQCPGLPPATERQMRPVTFRVPDGFAQSAQPDSCPPSLHPAAERVHHHLTHQHPNSRGLVRLREPGLPHITASPAQAARLARFLHELSEEASGHGCPLLHDGSAPAGFARDGAIATIQIDEPLDGTMFGLRLRRRPGGLLTVTLRGPRGKRRDVARWSETDDLPLARIRELAAARLAEMFLPPADDQPAIFPVSPPAKRPVFSGIRDLRRAAREWEEYCQLERYVAACEDRWLRDEHGLTPGRTAWLAWARGVTQTIEPFGTHEADGAPPAHVMTCLPEVAAIADHAPKPQSRSS